MELFDILPTNIFSVLTSKNKETYVQSLFIIRKLFLQESFVSRKILIDALMNEFESANLTFVEDDFNLPEFTAKINYIVNRLITTGWIESEYNFTTKQNSDYIILPPYSWKIITTLYQIKEENSNPYSLHLFTVYSNLSASDNGASRFQYSSLVKAGLELDELESILKNLNYDIKKRTKIVSSTYNTGELLDMHFNDYQKNIYQQIFLPLNTKDSIARFKGAIFEILLKWIYNPSIFATVVESARYIVPNITEQELNSEVRNRITIIMERLTKIESLVDVLYDNNNNYIAIVTKKMAHFTTTNQNTKKQIRSICSRIKGLKEATFNKLLEEVSNKLNITIQGVVDENSLYSRAQGERAVPEPIPFEEGIEDVYIPEAESQYSLDNLIEKMHAVLDDKKLLHVKDWKLYDIKEFTFAILGTLHAVTNKSFYKINYTDSDKEYANYDYIVPDISFEVI
jgi:hypothetical protein